MDTPQTPNAKQSNRAGIPRWQAVGLALLALLVGMPLVDFGVPWALSLLTTRYGWSEDRPGIGNLLGLIPIVVGEAGILWFVVTVIRHLGLLPERVKLELTSQQLMTSGPYAFTRNPRYLFAGLLWLGEVIFYGSIAALIGFVALMPLGPSLCRERSVCPGEAIRRGLSSVQGQGPTLARKRSDADRTPAPCFSGPRLPHGAVADRTSV